MTTDASINAMPAAAGWPRERSAPAPAQRDPAQGFDTAWQREMERMQSGAWFPGALPGLAPNVARAEDAVRPTREAPRAVDGPARAAVDGDRALRDAAPRRAVEDVAPDRTTPPASEVAAIAVAPQTRHLSVIGANAAPTESPVAHAAALPSEVALPAESLVARRASKHMADDAATVPVPMPQADGPSMAPLRAMTALPPAVAIGSSPVLGGASIRVPTPVQPAALALPRAAFAPSIDSAAVSRVASSLPAQTSAPALAAPSLSVAAMPSASFAAAVGMSGMSDADAAPAAAPVPGPRALPGAERALAAALARDSAPRLHLSWDGSAVNVWLGIDGAPEAAVLLRTVQRVLRQHGLELSTLVCNGRPLVHNRTATPPVDAANPQES